MSGKIVKFSIEGYRPFSSDSIHRGVSLELEEDLSPQEFLTLYKASLSALYKHEKEYLYEVPFYERESFEEIKGSKRVRFTVEGYQPGAMENVKRKYSVDIDSDVTIEEFLQHYKRGLDRLYRHEEVCCCSEEEASLLLTVS